MDRTLPALAVVALVCGCPFEPDENEVPDLTLSDSSAGSSGDDDDGSTEPTDSSPTDATMTDPSADDSDTGVGAVCGDGELQGDEVCDDGVNDGSYGGCVADCTAAAEHCGDGEANGPEVCDDGVNDGSYGGCVDDCTALGPHCGDGEANGPEQCDEGAANQNGSGCNIDCVVSGSSIGIIHIDGLDFCDGVFVTEPAFREDGNALVAATGYCGDDSVVLVEISPAVEGVQTFDLLLPETPVREAAMVGDDWVLASYGCNYVIASDGGLTEVCEPRVPGSQAIEGNDDGEYLALEYSQVAVYPDGSPMLGDAPSWAQAPPNNGSFTYNFYDATFGESGSVIVAGSRQTVGTSTYVAFVGRYTAAGNPIDTYTYGPAQQFNSIVAAPDGTVLGISEYPDYRYIRLDENFDEVYAIGVSTTGEMHAAFDSTGAIVAAYYDNLTKTYLLRKFTPDGQTELWNTPLANVGYEVRLAIDPADAIWIASSSSSVTMVERIAP
jgi:hypothetical protein